MKSDPKTEGRYAYSLERAMHEPSRLSILTSLVAHPDGLVFGDLKTLTQLTDGNLSRQIQILQADGLIAVEKSFVKNRPQTRCMLTEDGRKRFIEYIAALEQVVRDAGKLSASSAKRATAFG